eukprot:366545-Chlamydomonas_euryale.AAC.9
MEMDTYMLGGGAPMGSTYTRMPRYDPAVSLGPCPCKIQAEFHSVVAMPYSNANQEGACSGCPQTCARRRCAASGGVSDGATSRSDSSSKPEDSDTGDEGDVAGLGPGCGA